jgi:GGDEF domain-containing protein
VGRVGLTEFAVVAPGANRLGARRLAQRLQGAAHAGGGTEASGVADATGANGDGGADGALGLRAGYDSLRQLRTAAIEPRRLLGRAARALEMARAEGKWLREGARARES